MATTSSEENPFPPDELFRREFEPVYRFLLGMLGNEACAADAAQDTFRRAVEAWGRYEEKGRFRSWLFTIARREGLRVLRDRSRQAEEGEGEADDFADEAPWPDAVAVAREDYRVLREAVNELAAPEREVVLMRVDAGLRFREIAEITDEPLSTVLNRMSRAVAKLRKKWEQEKKHEISA